MLVRECVVQVEPKASLRRPKPPKKPWSDEALLTFRIQAVIKPSATSTKHDPAEAAPGPSDHDGDRSRTDVMPTEETNECEHAAALPCCPKQRGERVAQLDDELLRCNEGWWWCCWGLPQRPADRQCPCGEEAGGQALYRPGGRARPGAQRCQSILGQVKTEHEGKCQEQHCAPYGVHHTTPAAAKLT